MNKVPYQQASFRGVPFHVEAGTSDIAGRRAAIHEYAGRDESYPEDLGGKAKTFSLTAYVLGKSYQEKRDALITACTTKGNGELVHPYFGALQVLCTACSVSEGNDKGLMASFTLSFAKAPKTSKAIARPDTKVLAKNSARTFATQAEYAFLTKYTPSTMPSFASLDLTETVEKATKLVEQISHTADTILDAFNPVALANKVTASIVNFGFNDALRLIKDVSKIAAPLATSQAGLEVMRLSNELTTFTSRQALAKSATWLADTVFVSANEASQAFFAVDEQISVALEKASLQGEDSIFFMAQNMRYDLAEHIKKTAVHLPEVESILVTQTNASLPLAYDITGNADNALDFAKRNQLKHPSFATGGERFEVLNER